MAGILALAAFSLAACAGRTASVTEPAPTATVNTPASTPTAEPVVQPTPVPPTETSAPEPVAISAGNISQLGPVRFFSMNSVVRAIDFSPDGSLLVAAAGNGDSYRLAIWRVADGAVLHELVGHTAIVWDAAFSPDGQYVASSSKDRTVRVWRVDDGSQVQVFQAPDEVSSVAFTPDGHYLAYGGVDGWPQAAIWLVEVGGWNQVMKVEEGWNIPAILFTPDSLLMIAGGISRNVRAWYIPQGDQVYIIYFPGQVLDLALSPDAGTLAAAPCTESSGNTCQNVELWLRDAGNGNIKARLFAGAQPVQALQYTPAGDLLLTGDQVGALKAWAMPAGDLQSTVQLHAGSIEDLAISPDGSLLASASSDGTVRLWGVP